MPELYANEFSEIPAVLFANDELRRVILALVGNQPMPGKVTEGGDRLIRFREIMVDLVKGTIGLSEAIDRTETELPRRLSIHAANNRVFPAGWAERLVRIQFSRFYNQGVMEKLLQEGHAQCFIPHSASEDPSSPCSRLLAGRNHDLKALYDRLIQSYAHGNYSTPGPRIPDHPHCTHTVIPAG